MNNVTTGITKRAGNLDRENWIEAACRVLAGHGVEKVRVEPLAKKLGVTKGSFYWHFKNRQELLTAVLDKWEQEESIAVISKVNSTSEEPADRLWTLLEVLFDISAFKLEKAVRAWAQSDPNVALRMAQVDRQRIDHATAMFVEMGIEAGEAIARARLTMYAWVGALHVSPPLKKAARIEIAHLYHQLVTNIENETHSGTSRDN